MCILLLKMDGKVRGRNAVKYFKYSLIIANLYIFDSLILILFPFYAYDCMFEARQSRIKEVWVWVNGMWRVDAWENYISGCERYRACPVPKIGSTRTVPDYMWRSRVFVTGLWLSHIYHYNSFCDKKWRSLWHGHCVASQFSDKIDYTKLYHLDILQNSTTRDLFISTSYYDLDCTFLSLDIQKKPCTVSDFSAPKCQATKPSESQGVR